MPTPFIVLSPDPFSANAVKLAQKNAGQGQKGGSGFSDRYGGVRRPVRGIQLKGDTYAVLEVKKADGSSIDLLNAAGKTTVGNVGYSALNSNFMIQSIAESREEKQQMMLTFGVPVVFLFGEQPRMLQINGVLLNTEDFNWRAEWWENYDKHLRGTKCVESNSRVSLSWGDIVVQGYILSSTAQESAEQPNAINFSFNMLLTHYTNISNVGGTSVASGSGYIPQAIDVGETASRGTIDFAERRKALLDQIQSGNSSISDLLNNGQIFDAINAISASVLDFQNNAIAPLKDKLQSFIGARTVRVPAGFLGASAYGNEVTDVYGFGQDGAWSTEVKILGQNVVYKLSKENLPYTLKGTGQLRENEDEFVASIPIKLSKTKVGEMFQDSEFKSAWDDATRTTQILELYKRLGIPTDPPSQLVRFAAKGAFVAASLLVDFAMTAASQIDLSAKPKVSVSGSPDKNGAQNSTPAAVTPQTSRISSTIGTGGLTRSVARSSSPTGSGDLTVRPQTGVAVRPGTSAATFPAAVLRRSVG